MIISTNNSLTGKLFNTIGVNNHFHKYSYVNYDKNSEIISPVEAKVALIGKIKSKGDIISKNNRIVRLQNLIGKYSREFEDGNYINFYLNPLNKHFWITPCEGKFIYTQTNNGKSSIPILTGLENILGIEMFSKAVKKNASIGSIFQAKNYLIAMIAVGSLNVNKITVEYRENIDYEKATPCGYFSLGSSMLLCFSKKQDFSIKVGDSVKIGQKLK